MEGCHAERRDEVMFPYVWSSNSGLRDAGEETLSSGGD